jgi:hypothetical protein
MSVRTMARVWADSRHSGTGLLMLLAIADFADDDGRAYPAVTTLAAKCRMKPRNANYVLSALKASGELEIRINEGPKGTNLYRVVLERLGLQAIAPLQSSAPLHHSAPTPATHCFKPLQRIAAEPSMNHQEPSSTPTTKLLTCPHHVIVEVYHELLPMLPKVRMMPKTRKKALISFWAWVLTDKRLDGSSRATTAADALAWVRKYFERASENDFLMGRIPRTGDHAGWRCDLDFLLTEKGKKQVIEKTMVTA